MGPRVWSQFSGWPTSFRSARATCGTTSLLTEVGRAGRSVLLRRGYSATLEELFLAAEYVLKEGNEAVVLCERGIRTLERGYRFTLDLLGVAALKQVTHLPVIVDPRHAAVGGSWSGRSPRRPAEGRTDCS